MNALPPPEFVKIDPLAIEQDLITRYEKRSGKKLYPAQIEHLFIDQVDYALVRALSAIQQTGEQMLVSYSEAPIIDYLGELVGVTRLPAQPAVCTLRWQLDAPQSQDAFIPMFTGVSNDEDTVIFTTDYDVTIAAGTLYADVTATCRDVGKVGNGFNAGQVSKPGRSLPAGVTVANISTTSGGDAEESTEQLRERIKLVNVPAIPHTLMQLGFDADEAINLCSEAINEVKWADIKQERDRRIRDSDWTQLADISLTKEQKTDWKTYRQLLRDIPQTYKQPDDVVWPELPRGGQT
ncbi:phage tail assembly chaperone [Yersinia pseudotuberculosis]|uniref:phage tail assembly chaperone n=1 Tax=Yersinia pseudotuberculosis TaxID=633 RepID=UPI001A9DAB09|nr:phage tail assembly chaperone [Yersinia pseudotuberculosis]MBO1548756.1 hypothetical protein [Yersinia pseudotuberculosis]MBO1568965.1 hypothetical protein [Yersinia pseudotuberculosis]MBO1583696.1 hypothetical protein [Yersinia pseudotuberculosis]MBO1633675.1 hypothetical protein [Yersinia pseudotuberculosis]